MSFLDKGDRFSDHLPVGSFCLVDIRYRRSEVSSGVFRPGPTPGSGGGNDTTVVRVQGEGRPHRRLVRITSRSKVVTRHHSSEKRAVTVTSDTPLVLLRKVGRGGSLRSPCSHLHPYPPHLVPLFG